MMGRPQGNGWMMSHGIVLLTIMASRGMTAASPPCMGCHVMLTACPSPDREDGALPAKLFLFHADAKPHRGRPTLMGSHVRRWTCKAIVEVGDRQSLADSGAVWSELETA